MDDSDCLVDALIHHFPQSDEQALEYPKVISNSATFTVFIHLAPREKKKALKRVHALAKETQDLTLKAETALRVYSINNPYSLRSAYIFKQSTSYSVTAEPLPTLQKEPTVSNGDTIEESFESPLERGMVKDERVTVRENFEEFVELLKSHKEDFVHGFDFWAWKRYLNYERMDSRKRCELSDDVDKKCHMDSRVS